VDHPVTPATDPATLGSSGRPSLADLVELVRLPAVASVPGDSLAGAALACRDGTIPMRAAVALPVSSSLLYLAGMALNDYADRDVDAVERPHRPIPSGRVTPQQAAMLAHGLTGAGIAVAALAGRRSLKTAVALAAAVYAYDLVLKDTPAGPASIAACRVLDVLLGGTAGRMRTAVPAAAAIGAHTMLLSTVSRHEVEGSTTEFAKRATAAAGAVAGFASAAVMVSARRHPFDGLGLMAAYAGSQLREGRAAIADPGPEALQRMVGQGVLAIIPLQAAFLVAAGRSRLGAVVAAAWPAARRLARRRAVT
jgi:4-hydroxybenzoate polyprenyltransferase